MLTFSWYNSIMPSNLLTIANPELAKEYSAKNKRPVGEVTVGIAGEYLWNCSKCSWEWKARISYRLTNPKSCPICYKKVLASSNPELAEEWSKQNLLTPYDVKPGTRERFWWSCLNGHEDYRAAVSNRRLLGTKCSKCSPPPKGKSLIEVAPDLAKEWSTRNKTSVENTYAKSGKQAWWKCLTCSNEWEYRIAHRVEGIGCPKCENKIIFDKSVEALAPDLAKDWSPNNKLKPSEVALGSRKLVRWICSENHEYEMRPFERRDGSGCQICRLKTKSIAAKFPGLVKEFDIEKNDGKTAHDYFAYSGTPIWWKCYIGHSWKVSSSNRTSSKDRVTGCPECVRATTSKVEEELRYKLIEDEIITHIYEGQNATVNVKLRKRDSIKVDILGKLRSQNIVVEYDGWYWHSDQIKGGNASFIRDVEKTEALLEEGYLVVRIRESRPDVSLALLPINHDNLLQIPFNYLATSSFTENMYQEIYSWLLSK